MSICQIARITGSGTQLPEKILTNADLEKMVETSDEWIQTRTGMKERRIADADETSATMGVQAAQKALDAAGLVPEQIDMILCATLTPDYPFPATACVIQKELGCTNAAAMDIQAACTGYIYALSVSKAFIESGMHRHILIVASEKLSSIVDYTDRNTCVLFGDGACSSVVSGEGKGFALTSLYLGADGHQTDLLIMPGGGSKHPTSCETLEKKMHCIHMDGKEVFKHAVRRMEASARECIAFAGLSSSDIQWLVPHQANVRIIEAIAKRLEMPMEKVFLTIHKYGNTSASSVGIALYELLENKPINHGDHILLVGFGAGLTWGSCILKMIE